MDSNELNYVGDEKKGERFSIRWDPKEEILFIKFWGIQDKTSSQAYFAKFKEFADKIPGTGPISILVDLTENRKTEHEARRVYTEVAGHPRSGDSAMYGGSLLIKIITNFIAVATGRKDMKFFTTKEEGLKWLKGRK